MREFDDRVFERKWQRDIPSLLDLDPVGQDCFRSRFNQPNAYGALFGGQIVAQALAAADRTVSDDREVHSLHSYFLRAGAVEDGVDYNVEITRDGRRFSTRRVVASQGGSTIFSMECSYRTPLSGFSHQRATTVSFEPEKAMDETDLFEELSEDAQVFGALFKGYYPVEVRLPGTSGFTGGSGEAKRHYWLRAPGAHRCSDPAVHRQIFAFMSDFMLAGVTLSPHTVPLPGPHVFVASLDHSIWFHRELRCDDWLLFETDGPNAEKGVNLARGLVYDRSGRLVASLAQESLQYATSQSG